VRRGTVEVLGKMGEAGAAQADQVVALLTCSGSMKMDHRVKSAWFSVKRFS